MATVEAFVVMWD